MRPEGAANGLAQRLGAVDNEQAAHRGIEPALDQIVNQPLRCSSSRLPLPTRCASRSIAGAYGGASEAIREGRRYRRMRHQSRNHFDVFSLQNITAGSKLVWSQQRSRISPIRNADVDVAEADPRYLLPW